MSSRWIFSSCVFFAFCLFSVPALYGQSFADAIKLNSVAVTNSAGEIIVLGTEGSYDSSPNVTKEMVFDGKTSTFFDPSKEAVRAGNCWAGFQTQRPMIPTRVRYYARTGEYAHRIKDCLFQGANTADFSDAVTLHVAAPPANWRGQAWVTASVTTPYVFQTFTYFRIIGPTPYSSDAATGTCCGNAAEVEFYGIDTPAEGTYTTPETPVITLADAFNDKANLILPTRASDYYFEIERKSAFASNFTAAGGTAVFTNQTIWTDSINHTEPFTYRVRALNFAGTSAWSTVEIGWKNTLSGTVLGTDGSYGNNWWAQKDKLFDGNIGTYYDGAKDPPSWWAGLDLGATQKITAIRFLARPRTFLNMEERMNGGTFEIADTIDFATPLVIHTISNCPAFPTVTTVTLAEPVSARYIRYVSPSTGYGNATEIEFLTDNTPKGEITSISLSKLSLTNQKSRLTWTLSQGAAYTGTFIYRATSPGGPWSKITATPLPHGTTTWTDESMIDGICYWYQACLSYQDTDGTIWEGDRTSAVIRNRKCYQLERDPSDLTSLREGVTVVANGNLYSAGSAGILAFDGNIWTFPDLVPTGNTRSAVGVNLGQRWNIDGVRYYPRDDIVDRANGLRIYGGNDTNTTWQSTAAILSAATSGAGKRWLYQETDLPSRTNTYQVVFFSKPGAKEDFYANVAEMEVYGWAANPVVDQVLIGPQNLTFHPQANGFLLQWDFCANAERFRVERQTNDSGIWETLTDTLTEPRFFDQTVNLPYDGTIYTYRVTSLRATSETETEEALSLTYRKIPYLAGNGTGIMRTYTYPYYAAYSAEESVRLINTNAALAYWHWNSDKNPPIAEFAGSTNNFMILWSGKLNIPFDGEYKLTLNHDDGALFLLDGQRVISSSGSAIQSATIALTKGEHDVLVRYWEMSGDARCVLSWSGCVLEENIPSTQWTPTTPPALPAPWAGERTFGKTHFGWSHFNPTNQSFTLYGSGVDLAGNNEIYHYLWQTTSGSFDCSFRYQYKGSSASTSRIFLLVRNALEAGSPLLALSAANGAYSIKQRLSDGATISTLAPTSADTSANQEGWMRIKRYGNTIRFYGKNADEQEWRLLQTMSDTDGALSQDLFIGPAVSGSSENQLQEPYAISDFQVTPSTAGTLFFIH